MHAAANTQNVGAQMPEAFRDAMRRLAAPAVMPVSMDPPSMRAAVTRNAGLCAEIGTSRRFCVNRLGDPQQQLLTPFSQTARRALRVRSEDRHDAWAIDTERLPWLADAPAVIDCAVALAADHGTHTLSIGAVLNVPCAQAALAGQRAALSPAA